MNKVFLNYSEAEAGWVKYLLWGYVTGTLTDDEHRALDEWINVNDDNLLVFEKFMQMDEPGPWAYWNEPIAIVGLA